MDHLLNSEVSKNDDSIESEVSQVFKSSKNKERLAKHNREIGN